VELRAFEVWYDEGNRDRFARVAEAHGTDASGVPAVFVGGRFWVGDGGANRAAIAETVSACADGGCPDVAAAALGGKQVPVPAGDDEDTGAEVDVPLVGRHDVGGDSLLWATAVIAFADGFNPCSLWVLTVLLAMVLRTGSRGRVALIGGSYLVTAAAVYGLFLAGLFGALTVVEYSWWLRGGVAAFALAFAAINVKDYFWFGRGLSLTIPDRFKPRIARGSRSLALEDRRLPAVVALTVGLAAGVSLLELPCTAGFPVVWSNLLAARGTPDGEFAVLLAVYLAVFLLDELAIFAVAATAMRIGRVEERHGRVLKLGGGVLMGVLGVVMLVDPGVLEGAAGAVAVFGVAAVITAVTLLADTAFRPPPPPVPRPRDRRAARRASIQRG
jgi:cytochrome c biogenesis protein CcdA